MACILAAGLESVRSRLDVNWDLKNYHFYNAYAFVNGRLGWDLAPAQIQTYYNPLLDLPFYYLVEAIPSPRVIACIMGATTGVAAFALLRIASVIFPKGRVEDRALWMALAFAVGVTGSMGLSVIGSTMNEWPPAMMLMVSLSILVASIAGSGRPAAAALGAAGLVTGMAVGLKLTYGVFGIAMTIAIAAFGTPRERMGRALLLASFLLAGFLFTYGFWGATLHEKYGNPFFPYFNTIFKSPWWEDSAYFDRNFGPRDAWQALVFPLVFAQDNKLVSESAFSDWRLGTLFVLSILAGLKYLATGRRGALDPAWKFLAAFTLAAYLVWLKLFAIYRYLVPLEMLCGPLIVGCALYLIPGRNARKVAIAMLAIFLIGTTSRAQWGRLDFRGAYFDVAVPDVAPRSLVILGSAEPMAYAIPFFRPDTRFVSPANNFLEPAQENLLARQIREVIGKQQGPIYTLDYRGQGFIDAVLDRLGLARDVGSCLPIGSYLDNSAMRVCRVHRMKPGAERSPA